jgi:ferric-dicitrate binding protein FerR (iron transport regulator)
MSSCEKLSDFLSQNLTRPERTAFESHMEGCDDCRAEVKAWEETVDGLKAWADSRELERPSAAEAARLVDSARSRSARPLFGSLRPAFAAGLAAVVLASAAVVLTVWLRSKDKPRPGRTVPPGPSVAVLHNDGGSVAPVEGKPAAMLPVVEQGRLVVTAEADRIALPARSRVEVVRTGAKTIRLRLHRGTVAVEATPRKPAERLSVEAGGFTVTVVGTRFKVTRTGQAGLKVDVDEGKVEVRTPKGGRHPVTPGQSLTISDDGLAKMSPQADGDRRKWANLLRTPAELAGRKTAPPERAVSRPDAGPATDPTPDTRAGRKVPTRPVRDLKTWRSWILAGKYGKASRALTRYLKTSPADAKTWSVLADCYRKMGKWAPAVDALRKVIRHGSAGTSRRARYRAAVLLQGRLGRHSEAVRLLRQYLSATGPADSLRPHALMRCARSLIQLNRKGEARRLLKTLTRDHAGTAPAVKASEMLKKLN